MRSYEIHIDLNGSRFSGLHRGIFSQLDNFNFMDKNYRGGNASFSRLQLTGTRIFGAIGELPCGRESKFLLQQLPDHQSVNIINWCLVEFLKYFIKA